MKANGKPRARDLELAALQLGEAFPGLTGATLAKALATFEQHEEEKLYTVQQFRTLSGYTHVQSVYRAIRLGRIQGRKVGGIVMIPASALSGRKATSCRG